MEFFSKQFNFNWQLEKEESELVTELIARLEHKIQKLNHHIFGRELIALGFAELLLELSNMGKKHVQSALVHYGRKEDLATRFGQLAKKNHLKEHNISFYANQLFVTPKHLSQTVKIVLGKTAKQILDGLNIMEAKRLLANSETSISEIAHHLNFSSPAFFTKFFHQMEGISPRAYRNSRKLISKNQ